MRRLITPYLAIILACLGSSIILAKTFGNGDLPEFLQQFDTNTDDQIDEEERQAIRDLRAGLRKQKRDSIDTDNDGTIAAREIDTAREIIRGRIKERRRQKFVTIAGEDALISPTEYLTIPGTDQLPDFAFEAIWDHLDADRNGFISLSEFLDPLRRHN